MNYRDKLAGAEWRKWMKGEEASARTGITLAELAAAIRVVRGAVRDNEITVSRLAAVAILFAIAKTVGEIETEKRYAKKTQKESDPRCGSL